MQSDDPPANTAVDERNQIIAQSRGSEFSQHRDRLRYRNVSISAHDLDKRTALGHIEDGGKNRRIPARAGIAYRHAGSRIEKTGGKQIVGGYRRPRLHTEVPAVQR